MSDKEGVHMHTNISRRGFISSAAIGAASVMFAPKCAVAAEENTTGLGLGLVVQASTDDGFKDSEVCETRVERNLVQFDRLAMIGKSEVVVAVLPPKTEIPNGARVTTSSGYSDSIAKITIDATWSMSTNNKMVELNKVVVNFIQKGGEITKRGVIAWNNDLFIKKEPAALKCTIKPTWGYLPYYGGNESMSHIIKAWGKIIPSGMSGSATKVECKLTYGCYA